MPGTDDTPTTNIKNLELSSEQIQAILNQKGEHLGQGGFGTIYEIKPEQQTDTTTPEQQPQVIKEINLESDPDKPSMRSMQIARIKNEVKFTAQIKGHDKVNFHINEEDNKAYIIMPKEKGKDLFDYLNSSLTSLKSSEEGKKPYSDQSCLQLQCYLSLQVLDAVIKAADLLHKEHQIIHGDLMLENVFINQSNSQISSHDLSFIDFEDSSPIEQTVIKPLPNTPTRHKSPDRNNENEPPTAHPHHDWYTIASRMSNVISQICEGDLIRPHLRFLTNVTKYQYGNSGSNQTKLEDWQPGLTYAKLKQDLDNLKGLEYERVIDTLITEFLNEKMIDTSNSTQTVIDSFCAFCPSFLGQKLQADQNQFNEQLVKKAVKKELQYANDNMKNQAKQDLKNKINDINQFKQQYLKICEIGIYQRALEQYKELKQQSKRAVNSNYQQFVTDLSLDDSTDRFTNLCQTVRDNTEGTIMNGRLHKDSFMTCVINQAKDHPYGNQIFSDFLTSQSRLVDSMWSRPESPTPSYNHGGNGFFERTTSFNDRGQLLQAIQNYSQGTSSSPSMGSGSGSSGG